MGGYTVKHGDVFESIFRECSHVIIPHVCNNVGAWGKGFTEAIDALYPYAKYSFLQSSNLIGKGLLGSNIKVPVSKYNAIIHMVAQEGLRSPDNPLPLNYIALVECMGGVAEIASDMDVSIHCPKFGAGLAGGDWKLIEKMIKDFWVDKGLDVYVWEY